MSKSLFRWGILGTAQIARKNWQAMRLSGNGIVAAVASRSLARSKKFVAECQADVPFAKAPRALGSYDELVEARDIDGLYIPLPTGLRQEWVLRAAAAGKHVVSEKPCAVTVAGLIEMLDACRRNHVQFMDGVMFRHSARLERARQALDDDRTVGSVRRIDTVFNFKAPEDFFVSNIRARSELEPHGCLGDLGWYCIQFTLWTMGWQLPRRVSGRVLSGRRHPRSRAPVPAEFSGELFFDGGASGSFYCSFITELQQYAHISGERGSLHIPDFVLPYFGNELAFETRNPVFSVQGCDFNMEPRTRQWTVPEYSNSHPTAQETKLFRNFATQAQSGRLNRAWPQESLKVQQVLEACLASARDDGKLVECGDKRTRIRSEFERTQAGKCSGEASRSTRRA
jgi:predicted dehydrogenase